MKTLTLTLQAYWDKVSEALPAVSTAQCDFTLAELEAKLIRKVTAMWLFFYIKTILPVAT